MLRGHIGSEFARDKVAMLIPGRLGDPRSPELVGHEGLQDTSSSISPYGG